MNDLNGRKAKVKSWLNHFANELYTYQQCFLCNLISCDDIGKYHFDDICNKIKLDVENFDYEARTLIKEPNLLKYMNEKK